MALAAAVAVTVAGCSSGGDDHATGPGAAPATAAVAPPAATPAGTVTPAGPVAALLAEPATGRVAVLDTDRVTLRLLDAAAPARTLTLPAPATTLAAGAPGQILATAGRVLVRIDAATSELRSTPLDGEGRAAARRADGTVAVGLAGGRVAILTPEGQVAQTISDLPGIDALAAAGNAVAVLDRAQTVLTQLDLGDGAPGLALRAGLGATQLTADHFGRLLVTDTAGGALLVYTADPLVLHQRFPVGSSPYAIAYDQRSETVWVTLTASNEVAGFDLSTGIPEEVGRFATVRQPDTLTIDPRTGDMFVGSATGDGLQRIGADERKRGQ
ncbi:putative conserved lipoprotein LppL [Nocardia wallacei]|uniref:Putative conserved lipoprotein LppL n=1 Tax=Nocardia wallacei TaxID=480035 RepID=A0A7G1KL25_9NOCA|nr:putative conserved lipoprotein LppL [Nocardia wallacei]